MDRNEPVAPDGPSTEGSEGEPDEPPRGRIERLVLPFVRNELTLPVVAVVAANFAFGIALVLIHLIRDRAYLLAPVLVVMVLGSAKLVRAERNDAGQSGPLLVWVLIAWITGGVLTWALFDWL